MKSRLDRYKNYVDKHYPDKTVPEIAKLFFDNENHDVSLSTIERDFYRVVNGDKRVEDKTKKDEEAEKNMNEDVDPEKGPDWVWGKDEPAEEAIGLTEIEREYFYNKEDDVYIVFLRNRRQNVQVDGETVRQMKRAYSDQIGDGETINEVCHKFGWRRQDFHDFKIALGWTHDEDPFTDEEHVTKTTPDLVSDMAMLQRGEFERKWKRKKWSNTIKDAHKWRNFNKSILQPFLEHIPKCTPREEVLKVDSKDRDYMAVFAPQDLHMGKLTVDGEGVDETRDNLLSTTERLINQIKSRGAPDRTQLILGSDWWHVDTSNGTTTNGTPQDSDGLPSEALKVGFDLQVEMIDMLRTLGDVEVRMIPGNHDQRTCQVAWCGLNLGYKDVDDVKICDTFDLFQYGKYGRVALGYHHGHGPKGGKSKKPLKYGMLMAKHRPSMWGSTKFRYWLVGHLHGIHEVDEGVTILQTPSLSGDDRWHKLRGFTMRDRGQAAYLFDKENGLISRELALLK